MNKKRSKNIKLCPCCGQPIEYPIEFKNINTTQTSLNILWKLWKAKRKLVRYNQLHASKNAAKVYVYILRSALKDIGSKWYITTELGLGVRLKHKDDKD